MTVDMIGAGWAFPLRLDATGGVALLTREREVEKAMRLVLGTVPGERPMRPGFGCRLHEHVFAPVNAGTAGQIADEVRDALERWEPRIDVEDVTVSFDDADAGRLFVDILYCMHGRNETRNLVFPFYTIPEERPAAPSSTVEAGRGR